MCSGIYTYFPYVALEGAPINIAKYNMEDQVETEPLITSKTDNVVCLDIGNKFN
jgi:hypothetical protein